jgi:hypothetical protein
MGFRWSPPISNPPAEDLVARYASRWGIEQAFADARQIMGVVQARNRTRRAVGRTVPFGLICFSVVTAWYALHGHAPDDVTAHRARARWYTTKTEPSYDDMAVKLRRVVIAARFHSPRPEQATPQKTRAVLAAWAAAGARSTETAKHERLRRPRSARHCCLCRSGPGLVEQVTVSDQLQHRYGVVRHARCA